MTKATVSINRWLEHVNAQMEHSGLCYLRCGAQSAGINNFAENQAKNGEAMPFEAVLYVRFRKGMGICMKNWVILRSRSNYISKLVRVIDTEEFFPFIPTKEKAYRKNGVIYKKREPLFAGYMFFQTSIESGLIEEKFSSYLKKTPRKHKEYYPKVLSNYDEEYEYDELNNRWNLVGETKDFVVFREDERLLWESLLDENYCLLGSEGYLDGENNVKVTSGPLVGMEDKIQKINRHKRDAIVRFDILGVVHMEGHSFPYVLYLNYLVTMSIGMEQLEP